MPQKVWFGSREPKNEEIAKYQNRFDEEDEKLSQFSAGEWLIYPEEMDEIDPTLIVEIDAKAAAEEKKMAGH